MNDKKYNHQYNQENYAWKKYERVVKGKNQYKAYQRNKQYTGTKYDPVVLVKNFDFTFARFNFLFYLEWLAPKIQVSLSTGDRQYPANQYRAEWRVSA